MPCAKTMKIELTAKTIFRILCSAFLFLSCFATFQNEVRYGSFSRVHNVNKIRRCIAIDWKRPYPLRLGGALLLPEVLKRANTPHKIIELGGRESAGSQQM